MSKPQSASRACTRCVDLGKYRERVLIGHRSNGEERWVIRWVACDCRPTQVRVRLGKVIRPVPLMSPVDYPADANRPRTRDDCRGGPRPCPFVSCRMNNYLTVTRRGYIILTYEDREPDEVPPELSCAEDAADRTRAGNPPTLEEVGQAIGVTRERARQIEEIALAKVEMALREAGITKKDFDD